MSYPVSVDGPLTGIVRVYRQVDITRIHGRQDGFCAGLDIYLCLKVVSHAGVEFWSPATARKVTVLSPYTRTAMLPSTIIA